MDLIDRQQAIDALECQIKQCNKALGNFGISMIDEYAVKVERASLVAYEEQLKCLPPAQPYTAEEIQKMQELESAQVEKAYELGRKSVQPEEAIPISWIEAMIKKFMMTGDAFSGLTASIIRVMLNEWEKEQEGGTK